MKKPAHRGNRTKFDNTSQKCLSQKRNTTQTAEDAFERTDVQWISSLRPLDPNLNSKSERAKVNKTDINTGGTDENEKMMDRLENVNPPAFYDEDMDKWQRKFQAAKENRL